VRRCDDRRHERRRAIAFGAIDVAIAGGVEHMGRHPMGEGVDPNPRIVAEKIVDPSALVMGKTAENLHDRFPQLTKERCDAYAVGSQDKLAAAYAAGKIQPDLVPWPPATPRRAGAWRPSTSRRAPAPPWRTSQGLKTPFRPHGNVTAGNAAGLNDGATACILASEEAAAELGLPVRMRLVSFAFVGVEPEVMGIGPVPATEKALAKAGLTIEDIGLFELNEAFAVQVLAFLDHYGIADDDPRVNPYGGAIAIGHPLASSGAADDPARPAVRGEPRGALRPDQPCASASAWAAASSGRTPPRRLRQGEPEAMSETPAAPATRSTSQLPRRGRHPHALVRDVDLPGGAGTWP
jgi:acetyl-CoA acyltransferase